MGIFSGAKPSHSGPVFNFGCSGGQNFTKIFFNSKDGNNHKCVPNSDRIFRVKSQVTRDRFLTFPAPMVIGVVKVVKIRLKYFSAILMENDNNSTPNSVGMFRVQNQIVWLCFECKTK